MNIKRHITIILLVILHICKIRYYSQARTQRKGIREQGTGKIFLEQMVAEGRRKLYNQNGEKMNG